MYTISAWLGRVGRDAYKCPWQASQQLRCAVEQLACCRLPGSSRANENRPHASDSTHVDADDAANPHASRHAHHIPDSFGRHTAKRVFAAIL